MLFWHTKRLCWLGTEVEIQQGRCSNIQWCHWWIGQTVNHPKAEDLALASAQLLPCWDTGNFEQDWSPTVKWAIVLFLIDCCPWLTPCYHSAAINRNCLPVYAHTSLLAQDLLNFINSWHYHVFLQMLHLIDSNNISFLHASGYDYCRCLVAFCRAFCQSTSESDWHQLLQYLEIQVLSHTAKKWWYEYCYTGILKFWENTSWLV